LPEPAPQKQNRHVPPYEVSYAGPEKPGTILADTRFNLALVQLNPDGKGKNLRIYKTGLGRQGDPQDDGQSKVIPVGSVYSISRMAEWPGWTPPKVMITREWEKNHRHIPAYMPGGPDNPLGARALYLGASEYRIHGTNAPATIGTHVSSGCIRLLNEDIIDLYTRVRVGATMKMLDRIPLQPVPAAPLILHQNTVYNIVYAPRPAL
jgi:lipoprotein-anchoring transpeptidase ErfK/SrfK